MEERGHGAGEVKEVLEERDRQGATLPRAASRSAPALPFARGVSAFVWDGVQEIDTSFVCCTLARRASIRAIICLFATGLMDRVEKQFDAVIAVGDNFVSGANRW